MESLPYKDDERYEILDGKIVYMLPRPPVNHHLTGSNIHAIFHNYLKGKECSAFGGGLSVVLTEKDTVLPDAMIVCNNNIIKKDGIYGAPDLIVEVLSPGTAKIDKIYKKDLYARCGVREYWIVDIENRFVEVYLLKDNELVFDNLYPLYHEPELNGTAYEQKSGIKKQEFRTTLYEDLVISLEEVFDGLLF